MTRDAIHAWAKAHGMTARVEPGRTVIVPDPSAELEPLECGHPGLLSDEADLKDAVEGELLARAQHHEAMARDYRMALLNLEAKP